MKPNRRNISRLPIKYILNPDISEDSDLSSGDDSDDDYQQLNHDSSDSENKSSDNEDESSSDSDDDDNTNHAQQTQNEHKVQWAEVDPENISVKNIPFSGIPPPNNLPLQEPIEYFRDMITDELLLKMVEESNKYTLQIDITKSLNLSKAELEQFIGIFFLTSNVKMPNTRDYWEQSLQYKTISKVMPIRRFERIKQFLHCNDNTQTPRDGNNKLSKIRPIINTLKSHFHLSAPTENLFIDEQMVPFKGRSRLKQYNPQKPKK